MTLQRPFGTDRRITNAGGAIRLHNHKDTIMPTKFTFDNYQTIAITMRNAAPPITEVALRQQHYADCKALATMLTGDNPWFNANMFLYKCGYQMEGMAP